MALAGLSDSLRETVSSVSVHLDPSIYRSSLSSMALAGLSDSLRGTLGSASVHLDPSIYRSSLSSMALAGLSDPLRGTLGSISLGPWLYERPPVQELPSGICESTTPNVTEEPPPGDLSILIRFPAANEREILVSVVRMTAAYRLLHCFEVRLRETITVVMESKFGPNWMRKRVSPKIVALWEEKRAKAEQKGLTTQGLLNYADFTDYLGIIVQRDNWRDAFQSVFGNQKDTEVSFERLQPLRVATMHNRPLTGADGAVLATEVCRLLRKTERCRLN
jgi:hypothetical protein